MGKPALKNLSNKNAKTCVAGGADTGFLLGTHDRRRNTIPAIVVCNKVEVVAIARGVLPWKECSKKLLRTSTALSPAYHRRKLSNHALSSFFNLSMSGGITPINPKPSRVVAEPIME